jgi:hypothetical protein
LTFTQEDARAIARKIDAVIEPGRRHDIAVFRHEGKRIAQFGIRRGSKEQGHDYIPRQLHLTQKQCLDLCACPLSLGDYVALLRAKNLI